MSAKEEIERRLRKHDYTKISRDLFNKSFDNLNSDEWKQLLKIADQYGSKYIKIYSLKNENDIDTITSNLVAKEYTPTFKTHNDLKVIYTHKEVDSFVVFLEFFTQDVVWKEEEQPDGKKFKIQYTENLRRIMTIKKQKNNNFVIMTIDPIGEGSKVYKKINENIMLLADQINLNFQTYWDNKEVIKGIFDLIANNELIARGLSAVDESTKRAKTVTAYTAKDNIKDDDLYKKCLDKTLNTDNLKMKYKKETLELFGETLIKFSTNADGGTTDEFTRKLIRIL